MGFLSPWFLAGLAALSLPVWLHLLRRHRSTPLRFSSLMFFEQRTQSSIRHRRLHYLLLFSLRMLLLFLLALAFAGPYISGKIIPAGSGQKMTVLAVDHSFSMRQGDRLGRAKAEARRIASQIPAGERAQVVALGGQVQLVGEPTADRGALEAAIESIEPADSRASYGELARALRSISQSARVPLEVHLFSDMQKSSLPPAFADLQLPAGTRLVTHAMAGSRLANWAVESVSAPRRVHDPARVRIQATVAGYGTEAVTRTVSLVLNGKVLQSRTIEVPADGRAVAEFVSLEAPYGLSRGEVRLEPADQFPNDDRYLFSVERADPQRVLFVHEHRDTRSPLYFRAAIDASGEAVFALETVTAQQVGTADPTRYAFVVLSNVTSVPGNFEEGLRKYVRDGGSLLVALGPAAAVRGKVPVIDGPILESRYSPRSGERFQSVNWVDPAHPSIRRAGRWEGVKFYHLVRVDPGGARVLARASDETPVLLEQQAGAGRVLVFASAFDNVSNDFPLHASFVPFVEQTAQHLSGLEERPSSLPVGAYLPLRAGRDERTSVEVIDPDGRRALDLSEAATAQDLLLAREGFYEVRHGTGRRELVAANADRRESDFEIISEETLALWENTGEGSLTAAGGTELPPTQRSLWWHALLVVLMLGFAESLVGARYLTTRKEAA